MRFFRKGGKNATKSFVALRSMEIHKRTPSTNAYHHYVNSALEDLHYLHFRDELQSFKTFQSYKCW